MRTIAKLIAVAAALAVLIPLAIQQFGRDLASRQAEQADDAFQQQLDREVAAGRIVRKVDPDGRVRYINSSLPEAFAPAPGSADSPQ